MKTKYDRDTGAKDTHIASLLDQITTHEAELSSLTKVLSFV